MLKDEVGAIDTASVESYDSIHVNEAGEETNSSVSKRVFGFDSRRVSTLAIAVIIVATCFVAIGLGLALSSKREIGVAESHNTTGNIWSPPSDHNTTHTSGTEVPSQRCPSYPAPPPLPGKRGAAFTMRNRGENGSWVENTPMVLALQPYWFYTWAPNLPEEARSQLDGIEFVPMIWGAWSLEDLNVTVSEVRDDVRASRLLGFNEPDRWSQSSMNVDAALDYWTLLESSELPLVSPACAEGKGDWMKEFMNETIARCLRVDFVAIHWYGPADTQIFRNELKQYYLTYGKPVMLTEFAPADWNAKTVEDNIYSRKQILAFMQEVLPWLESQDWVAAYSWFPFDATYPAGTCSSLFNTDGSMTELGMFYSSVTNDNPTGNQSMAIS